MLPCYRSIIATRRIPGEKKENRTAPIKPGRRAVACAYFNVEMLWCTRSATAFGNGA